MVAVDVSPPQHSPMFGHLASSQTVESPRPLKSFLMLVNLGPEGIVVFSHDGRGVRLR